MIKRIIVVTPSSLVKNWQQEVRKWLGDERLPVLALQPGPDAAKQVLCVCFVEAAYMLQWQQADICVSMLM